MRVHIDDESERLLVSRRSFLRPSSGGVDGQVEVDHQPQPQRLRAATGVAERRRRLLALRVPQRSKVVPRLDALLEITGDEATMRRAASAVPRRRRD